MHVDHAHGVGVQAPSLLTRRRSRLLVAAIALFLCAGCRDHALAPLPQDAAPTLDLAQIGIPAPGTNAALQWTTTALEAVSQGTLGPPMVARALAMVHTAAFDAWAAFDGVALGTVWEGEHFRRPEGERTEENRIEALSYAAYRILADLFPDQVERFDARMSALGFDPEVTTTDPSSPAGVGNRVAELLLHFRHQDGANQHGDLGPTGAPYSDYTGYQPVNTPDDIRDPNYWQPLRHPTGEGSGRVEQAFLGVHWDRVAPFALPSADALRPPPPKLFPHGLYREQAEELIRMSANLTEREKMIAEYWADGPGTVLPPGHFTLFGQWVSRRDGHGLDEDVTLFFLLTNAMHDAAIAAWDAKIHYDYVRPITAIRYLKAGRRIRAWAGPGQGTRVIRGEDWMPFQAESFPTPPFSEYVSGHSTFSAAGAEILKRFTGSDRFDAFVVISEGPLGVEAGVPARPVVLSWTTFSEAADEAGLSRRYGGIHFRDGDLEARRMGRAVAELVWHRGKAFIQGTVPP
jgi:hypothetical protein